MLSIVYQNHAALLPTVESIAAPHTFLTPLGQLLNRNHGRSAIGMKRPIGFRSTILLPSGPPWLSAVSLRQVQRAFHVRGLIRLGSI